MKQKYNDYIKSLDTSGIKMYLVGGAVREIVRGYPEKVKDWDFSVEAESFAHMRKWLEEKGFNIFLETPEYYTIRARAPKDTYTFAGLDMTGKTFDFTLCRSEGVYTDGRHPDEVSVGTIKEDLARRDFTMNAIAMDGSGSLLDPFGGAQDIEDKVIRCVGSTERLREDSLRMLRAIRFAVQLDFQFDAEIAFFVSNFEHADLLDNISEERIRDELTKAFKVDTLKTLNRVMSYPAIARKIFNETGIWLLPTSKGR